MPQRLREKLISIAVFVGVIWGVFALQVVLPGDLIFLGLTPRTPAGLIGILAMPLLHGNLRHLVSNTVPLFILLALLTTSQERPWKLVAAIVLLGGGLLWLIGRPSTHIGASGLVSGLIILLIATGLLEKRPMAMLISVLVGIFYGGSLLWGILPWSGSQVSWEGHLCGAIAGGAVAYYSSGPKRIQPDLSGAESYGRRPSG